LIVGPPGVGKTTIAVQLVGVLCGLQSSLLGYPIQPARRVLYLAMDRPRQIKRAMLRKFKREHETLRDRLVVHRGPLPADLTQEPEILLRLAQEHDCDVIVVDSLKDAAIKLSDDDTGGFINRAIQYCNANGVDVCVLHHQRKSGRDGGKPTRLEDVYGSTWITAGAGSVVLLWGEPGDELVEFTHLKQPADPVGPLQLAHDHIAGTTEVVRGFDPLAFLRNRGAVGASLGEAARAEHGEGMKSGGKEWKRTERRLRRLVKEGLARHDPQGGVGGEARYFAVDILVDTSS
jgi:replicative DNA helicase